MKKILTLLIILFGVSLVGGLYHTFAHIDKVGYDTADYTYTEKFIPEMPDITIDTTSLMPLY
jgi:hypothetical protein